MLTNQQAFPGDTSIDILMASSNLLQASYKVLAFLSCLFWNTLFQRNMNGSDSSSAGQGISTGCRGMNKWVAIQHTPDTRSRHKRSHRHDTTAQSLGRSND